GCTLKLKARFLSHSIARNLKVGGARHRSLRYLQEDRCHKLKEHKLPCRSSPGSLQPMLHRDQLKVPHKLPQCSRQDQQRDSHRSSQGNIYFREVTMIMTLESSNLHQNCSTEKHRRSRLQ